MKVKEIIKKINYGNSKLPVILQEGISGEPRQAVSFDYAGYYFKEADRTVQTISILNDKVIIYYK